MHPRRPVALFLLLTSWSAFSQNFERNGLPCVAEICIGDGIAELRKVPWDKAKNPFSAADKPLYASSRKLSEGETRMVNDQYRGNTAAAAPYLVDKLFDGESLEALSRVSAACTQSELVGTYTTKSGNLTRVTVSLTPARGPTSEQHWIVTKLLRTVPSAVTKQQMADATAELSERYRAFDLAKTKNAKPGEARFAMNGGSLFEFQFFLFQGLDEGNRLKQHPLCGGAAKVKVD